MAGVAAHDATGWGGPIAIREITLGQIFALVYEAGIDDTALPFHVVAAVATRWDGATFTVDELMAVPARLLPDFASITAEAFKANGLAPAGAGDAREAWGESVTIAELSLGEVYALMRDPGADSPRFALALAAAALVRADGSRYTLAELEGLPARRLPAFLQFVREIFAANGLSGPRAIAGTPAITPAGAGSRAKRRRA